MAKKKTGPSNTFIPGLDVPRTSTPTERPPWGDIGQTWSPPKQDPPPSAQPSPKVTVTESVSQTAQPLIFTPQSQSYSPPVIFNNPPPPPPPPVEKIVKTPDRFLTVFQEDVTASTLEKILFENIGGIEIANIERHDTIDGKNPYYTIIANLSKIRQKLDPISLISRQRAGLRPGDFGKQISLSTKIPLDNYLRDNNLNDYIFIDDDINSPTYGSLIIDLVNINSDELIEIEIATNGTIYEVDA